MSKFTVLSCARDTKGGPLSDLTTINFYINDFGRFEIKASCYDSYYNKMSQLISKLPIIRDKVGFTDFQKRYTAIIDCLKDCEELIVGTSKSDIKLLTSLCNSVKEATFNVNSYLLNINNKVREMLVGLPQANKNTRLLDVATHYGVYLDDALDLGCIIFDVDSWDELTQSSARACVFLLAKLNELGYSGDTVIEAVTKYCEEEKSSEVIVDHYLERSVTY